MILDLAKIVRTSSDPPWDRFKNAKRKTNKIDQAILNFPGRFIGFPKFNSLTVEMGGISRRESLYSNSLPRTQRFVSSPANLRIPPRRDEARMACIPFVRDTIIDIVSIRRYTGFSPTVAAHSTRGQLRDATGKLPFPQPLSRSIPPHTFHKKQKHPLLASGCFCFGGDGRNWTAV